MYMKNNFTFARHPEDFSRTGLISYKIRLRSNGLKKGRPFAWLQNDNFTFVRAIHESSLLLPCHPGVERPKDLMQKN